VETVILRFFHLLLPFLCIFNAISAAPATWTLAEFATQKAVVSYREDNDLLSSISPVVIQNGPPLPINRAVLQRCLLFDQQCLQPAEVVLGDLKEFPRWMNEHYHSGPERRHGIETGHVIRSIIGAGMLCFILPQQLRNSIPTFADPLALESFEAGETVAQYTIERIRNYLRSVFTQDQIMAILHAPESRVGPTLEQALQYQYLDLRNFQVPRYFVLEMHQRYAPQLSVEGTVAAIPDATKDLSRVVRCIELEGIVLLRTGVGADYGSRPPPNPYGYHDGRQQFSMLQNYAQEPLMKAVGDRQLNRVERFWYIIRGAIRYLYENPLASVEGAVSGGFPLLQGMLFDEQHPFPLGEPGDELNQNFREAERLLMAAGARDLCQVGRWREHLPWMRQIYSKTASLHLVPFIYAEVVQFGELHPPAQRPINLPTNEYSVRSQEIRIVLDWMFMINNHGCGDCGVYSLGFGTRRQFSHAIRTIQNWQDITSEYLRNGRSRESLTMLGQLNGNATALMGDGYLRRLGLAQQGYAAQLLGEVRTEWEGARASFLQLSPAEQQRRKGLHPGASDWDPEKAIKALGPAYYDNLHQYGLDFGIAAALLGRPIRIWSTGEVRLTRTLTPTEKATGVSESALIWPDGQFMHSSEGSQICILFWPGHFVGLSAYSNMVRSSALLRHFEARLPQ
jgi:hypothetical protein